MRGLLLSTGVLLAAFCIAGGRLASAQTGNDSSSQAPAAPQPQKKQADKASQSQAGSSSSQPSAPSAGEQPPAAQENPFPEAVSRRAAGQSEDASESGKTPSVHPSKESPAAEQNPFPEDVSRQAANKAGSSGAQENDEDRQAPASENTSGTVPPLPGTGAPANSRGEGSAEVRDPGRAKKDTQVGEFYLQSGDLQGAYLRYKDAIRYDPGNVDAIFGLAEAAKALKKYPEAERNYQLYLEVIPNGSKAKRARKALDDLAKNKP